MGDFNDYASNQSLEDVLVKDDLVNLMATALVTDVGSYNYKGEWNFIDHMIVSKNSSIYQVLSAGSFSKEFMLYEKQKGDKYPSRTYGGSVWYGGFSDHLPVYCQLSFTF